MALTSRTSLEEVIARFTSEEQSRVSTTAVISVAEMEKSKHKLFSFAVPEIAKIKLDKAGIYLSPYSYRPHSHPVCKTLENNILYNILPNYLDNSFYLVSIKKNKVDFLKRRHADLQMLETINRYVSSLDKLRYGNFFHVSPSKVKASFKCDRRTGFEDDASLQDLLPQCVSDSKRNFFFHDELHYWSKEALITFLDHVKPEIMLASIVYPPEILSGAKESLNPWCYKFRIIGKDLVFSPDGCDPESYIQPLSGHYLLKTRRIITPSGDIFNLDLVKSVFSHHLISITKGEAVGQSMRFFNDFEAVSMRDLNPLMRNASSCIPISKSVILKIYRYLRTLKKPDLQSAVAKLSQISHEPNGYEIKFFDEFAKLCLKCETVNTNLLPDVSKLVQNFFIKLFPNFIGRRFKVNQQLSLDNFVEHLEEYNFYIETTELSLGWKDDLVFVDLTFGEQDFDVDHIFDENWGTKKDVVDYRNVHHQPYSFFKFNSFEMQFTALVDENSHEGIRAIAELAAKRFSTNDIDGYTEEKVLSLAIEIAKKSRLGACMQIESTIRTIKKGVKKSVGLRKWKIRPTLFFNLRLDWFFRKEATNIKFIGHSMGRPVMAPVSLVNLIHKEISFDSIDEVRSQLKNVMKKKWLEKLPESKVRVGFSAEPILSIHKKEDAENLSKAEDGLNPTAHNEPGAMRVEKKIQNLEVIQCKCDCCCIVGDVDVRSLHGNFQFYDLIGGSGGREASLFSRDGKGYSYPGFSHKSRGWPSYLDQFLADNGIPGDSYNQCLVQRYLSGKGLGMHKDDEEVYELDHQVLTINYTGHAFFGIECNGIGYIHELNGPKALLMPFGFQINHRHGISNPSIGRISLTFRLTKVEKLDALQGESPVVRLREVQHMGPTEKQSQRNVEGSGVNSQEITSGIVAGQNFDVPVNLATTEFQFELDPNIADYVIRNLGDSSSSRLLTRDMCLCNSPWLKSDELKFSETIRDLVFASGMSPTDRFIFSDAKRAGSLNNQIADLQAHIFVLRGDVKIQCVDDPEINASLSPGFFSSFLKWRIIHGSYDVIIGATIKPCKTAGGEYRSHCDECELSDLTERLHGCSMILSRKFEPDKYHTFNVPGDGNCFWHSVGPIIGVDGVLVKDVLRQRAIKERITCPRLKKQLEGSNWAEREAVAYFCSNYGVKLNILHADEECTWIVKPPEVLKSAILINENLHYQPCMPVNGCVIRAIASALGRREVDVLAVLGKPEHEDLFDEVIEGKGFSIFDLSRLFAIFSICANVDTGSELLLVNEEGKIQAEFSLEKEHLAHIPVASRRRFSPIISELNKVTNSAMNFLALSGSKIDYKPSFDRASTLMDCLAAGITGVLCQGIKEDQQKLLAKLTPENSSPREMIMILGTFGCGKSTLFKKFIEKSPGKAITFVSPRRSLAEAITTDLGLNKPGARKASKSRDLKNVRVKTFELFLLHLDTIKDGHTIVIDEIQLFPPGYVDLILFGLSPNVRIIVAGDPCQSDYDSSTDRHVFMGAESDVCRILNGCSYKFNILSQRFRNPMFVGRLPCAFSKQRITNDELEYTMWSNIQEFSMVNRKDFPVVLVSSFEEKKVVAVHLGMKIKCLTFGESTGLNFQKGAILVSFESAMAGDRRWWTALSRFSHDIHLINAMSCSWPDVLSHFVGKPLHKFLTKRASKDDIIDLLPGKPELIEGFQSQVGAEEGIREEKMEGDPWLKTGIFLGQSPDVQEIEMQPECLQEDWFKTHIPIYPMEAVRAEWVHRLLAKEAREFRIGTITTEQFTDEHSKNCGLQLTNAAERYEAIYPRHKGTDTATFLMAVKKRLSFSSPSTEHSKLRRALPFGRFLLETFLKKVPLERRHNSDMMARAIHDFEEKKLSKSKATIENHSGRSNSDWPVEKALIFMKSQLCTKFDNRFRSAKAGQTLACFQHSVLCRFAPYMRYIEFKLFEALPNNLYIHSGKNIDDLAAWVKSNNFLGTCTESDYEAFDASQDHYILAFELELMKYLGLPSELIADYLHIKTHLGSKLGNFAIMRFTGEASTFLFNTMANMLFTFLRYDLSGHESICFAGDDMCANTRLKVTGKHEKFLEKIKLKAKVQFTVTPTFCGWGLCKEGVFKKPDLVLERLQIARETKNLENCIDNYAIEISCAYKMGENLAKYLTPSEINSHYNCVRFVVKHNHLLKSSIKDLFRSEHALES